jgi:general secretion pathway protein D
MRRTRRILFLFIIFVLCFQILYAKTEKITLNFDDVDINIFLKTMSEITGKGFVLSEKVRGKISFVSSRDVPVSRVYDIVLAILKTQGFLVVPGPNNVVQVIPAQEALKMSGDIFYGTDKLTLTSGIIVTQIVPIVYAAATDVLNVIRPLFATDLLITAFPATNVIIANGEAPSINLLISMIQFLDTPIPQPESDIHIYNLQNSDADTMAKTLTSLSSQIPIQKDTKTPKQPQTDQSYFIERFKVVANKETNSLLIISAPEDWEKIKDIIEELDVRREQVLVEALIIEVTLNEDEVLGFDLRGVVDTGDFDIVAQSNTGLVAESLATGGLPGLTVGLLDGTIPDVYAILNANKENTNFKILSTPEIVTLENDETTTNSAEQIPFLTSSRVDENNNVIQTFDYRNIGIVLKLTPQINKSGYITMNIFQQVQKIVAGTELFENPSVFNREITSKVTVKDQRTIVLGGLIRDDITEVEQKVPILGDIPILGLFFRKKTKQRNRTNLLVFLTPHIVTDDREFEKITEEKKAKQEAFEDQFKRRRDRRQSAQKKQ